MHNKPRITPLPLLTFLAFCWPFLNFLDVNKTMLRAPQVVDVLIYLGMCLTAVLVFWTVLYVLRVLPKIRLALDAAFAVSIALFFSFPIIMSLIANGLAAVSITSGGFLVYGVILLLAFILAVWGGTKGSTRSFALVFFLTASAVPAVRYLTYEAQQALSGLSADPTNREMVETRFETSPDVYFLIMDNYPRSDFLQRYFDHDNSAFLDDLRARGFIVNEDFNANYPSTFLSLASTFDMEYGATPETTVDNRDPYIAAIVGDGLVQNTFRSAGYKIAHGSYKVTSGGCQGDEDYCLDKGLAAGFGEIEYGLLSLTPVAAALGRVQFYGLLPQTLDQYIKKVGTVPVDESVFYFIHSNPPHHPLYMTDQCIDGPIGAFAANESDPSMKEAFAISVDCSNRGAIEFIDYVLSRDPEAVVILQSDHGSSSTVDWSSPASTWSQEQVDERLAALSAIRAPQGCEESVRGLKSSVNTFRVVIACLEGLDPILLEDRHFINTYENANDFGQVHEVVPGRPAIGG
jgi:hypothetical protein